MSRAEAILQQPTWFGHTLDETERGVLRRFINASSAAEAEQVWPDWEARFVSQNSLLPGADVALDVFFAVLIDDRPPEVKDWILESIRYTSVGGSADIGLANRCAERARSGAWLLASLSDLDRGAVVSILQVVDERVSQVF